MSLNLLQGTEQCDYCLQWYEYEEAFYCAECDSQVCPACVIVMHASEVVLCPECARLLEEK
jgi:hypothetical protein